ncbi:hypothetical protein hairong_146 [Pseudomonas phage hairong]|nr:hypothetical protein hairong_146 [Pseudomonas phage hairong]
MKDLSILIEQVKERGMPFAEYAEKVGPVIPSQMLFSMKSCEGDHGFVLKSSNGNYHIWFVGTTSMGPGTEKSYHVTETSTWYPHQLGLALDSLCNQMQIDCERLIEENGEKRE